MRQGGNVKFCQGRGIEYEVCVNGIGPSTGQNKGRGFTYALQAGTARSALKQFSTLRRGPLSAPVQPSQRAMYSGQEGRRAMPYQSTYFAKRAPGITPGWCRGGYARGGIGAKATIAFYREIATEFFGAPLDNGAMAPERSKLPEWMTFWPFSPQSADR